MDLRFHHCFLAVDDHDRAIAFYRDALGLEIQSDVGARGMRWVTLSSPEQPGLQLVLHPPAAEPGISDEDRRAINELLAKGLLGRIDFATPDLDATFERVQASGADVVQEPMDQPWGARDCAVRDPAGNMIRISQASA